MIKVHLDTDLGGDTDDLCALAMLLKWPDVQITGITTNTEKDGKRAGYTKYALKVAGRSNIPVRAGADISGGYYRGTPGLPKESDYWPEPIEPSYNSIDAALELLNTNLFLLDQKYPNTLQKAKLYLMGGYIYPIREGYPQWSNNMDWNIQADIKSAKYVLENSYPTLIPLSLAVETSIRRSYLPTLRKSGKLGEIMATQAEAINKEYRNEEKIGKTCKGLPDDILNFQHDALACAIALGWSEGVKIEEILLEFDVKDSWLFEHIDNSGKPTKVVTQVDGNKFNEFWLKTVTKS